MHQTKPVILCLGLRSRRHLGRHCERSEAIYFCLSIKHLWIAASLRSSR
jgi:hypothetical protein